MQFKLKITLLICVIVLFLVYLVYTNRTDEDRPIIAGDFIQAINDESEIDLDGYAFQETKLLDLKYFRYIINAHTTASHCNSNHDLLGIILVTSYVGHDAIRSVHRQAFSEEFLLSLNLVRIFMIAEIPKHERFINQPAIEHEANIYGDMIQGSFQEAYRNLTYKHMMGLKWAVKQCKRAKFIIKVDDDAVFDITHFWKYLRTIEDKKNSHYLAGYTFRDRKVIRLKQNKWFVTRDEYSFDRYPDYVSGWLYVMSQLTAQSIILKSHNAKYFWIDDVFVTGIMRDEIGVQIVELNAWFSANSQYLECCIDDLNKQSYECDYKVGPNGGDIKLILKYNEALRQCNPRYGCKKRPPDRSLKKRCIAKAEFHLQNNGLSEVKRIKL